MPAQPEPIEVLTAIALRTEAKVDKILAQQTASPPPAPIGPPPKDEIAEFLALFAPPTAEEWRARYGTAIGQPIPQMTSPDEAEAMFRARAGYNWRGSCFLVGPETQWRRDAVDPIAHATDVTVKDPQGHPEAYYYTGAGMVDPTFAAFAVLTGLIEPRSFWIRSLDPGPPLQKWVGYTVARFLQAQNALVSGGDPGPSHG